MEPDKYLRGIKRKLGMVQYHYKRALTELGSEPYALYLLGDKKDTIHLVCESHFISVAAILHSCLDNLAQWLNAMFLNQSEESVSFKKIIPMIEDTSLRESLQNLSDATIYLDDLVNYFKHRSVICIKKETVAADMGMPYMEFLVVCPFTRKNRNYPQRDFLDVLKEFQGVMMQINKIMEVAK